MGCEPTTFQFLQHLTPQTSVLTVAAIQCVRSGYASLKKATVMLCQDEYQGELCPSPVINLTPEATVHNICNISWPLYALLSAQLR